LWCSGHLVHFLDCHGFLVLLSNNGPEFQGECCLEQVHLEEDEHHCGILSPECLERMIGVTVIAIIKWCWSHSSVICKAFLDYPGGPCDPCEELICHLIWLHGQVG
jgi:hypothetical protein